MNQDMPLVFIVLLNYNGSVDTIDCLDSLRKVVYPNMKVIVVDNASSDESASNLKAIQSEYGFVFLQSKENNGFSAGNNIGIKYALENKADYVLLLNNDTVVEPDFLLCAIKASERDSTVGLTIGRILYYEEPDLLWYGGGEFQKPYYYAKHLGFRENKDIQAYNTQRYVTYATGCYFLLKAEAINKVGLMKEDYFLYCEDTDYSIRMVRSGYKMLYCPKSLIYHKVSASTGKGSSFSTYYIARNNMTLYKRYFSRMTRVIALLYWLYKIFRSAAKGNLDQKAFWKGIRAGLRGETGKVNLKL